MKIDIVRKMHLEMKVKARLKVHRIIGVIGFRNHFSSSPGRHSWDLCGHPVYWWVFKSAAESKYLEKILLWTEVEQAWKDALEMSPKFVIWKRSVEECIEPEWEFVDDLKLPDSRVKKQTHWLMREAEIERLCGFKPTLRVDFGANQPMVSPRIVDELIEKYLEDDIAEMALTVSKGNHTNFWMRDPDHPEYLMRMNEFSNYPSRQEKPVFYDRCGISIYSCGPPFGSVRPVYIEVGRDECVDIHNKEDLELARFYMHRRLKEK